MARNAATEKTGTEVSPPWDVGIVTLKANYTVEAWNPRAAHLTGYSLEAINITGFLRLFDPREIMHQLLQQAREGMSTARGRVQLRRTDGQQIALEVECSPLQHSEPGAAQFAIAMREPAPAPGSLGSATRLHMLSHLARLLSHEIRNPMNAIFLHADIIEEELHQPVLDDRFQVDQSLGTLKAEVMRLSDLVQDYLSLARLSELPREPEDLRAFLEAFAREVQEQLTARGVALHMEGLEGLGTLAVHRSTLRRALLGIVAYAMDAIPHGGGLTVRSWRTASHVYVAIHDVGTRLQVDQLSLLSHPHQASDLEGSALGFAVAQEIVAAHGGVIEAIGEPGKDMTLIVILPVKVTEDRTNG